VVTFDHGLGGFRSQNTFLAEELASHGAVVVAVEHPGGSLLTVLPDGAERPFQPLPRAEAPDYGAAVAALGARWTAETLAALEAMRRVRTDGPLGAFAGALDFGRVVATGHSTGGAVAIDVCHAWDGCAAAVALDGWWLPVDAARRAAGPEKPLVSVASDPAVGYFAPANRERFEAFAARGTAPVVDLVLVGSGHHDLNDTALLSPIADRFGHSTGPVPAASAFAALRALALAVVEATEARSPSAPAPTDDAGSALVASAALRQVALHPVLVAGETVFGASPASARP
jgi:predicted dienelactone hydrolase